MGYRGILFLACFFAGSASAATINVPADQSTIQAAIDAANNGDTVLVAPGTYYEQLVIDGKNITVKSSGGAAVTTLDGNDTSPIVVMSAGTSVLQGFTLTHAASNPNLVSAAVILSGDASTIEDDVFVDNSVAAQNPGASAIFGDMSSATVVRNYFAQNAGADASARVITWLGGSAVVADNVFVNNPAVAFWVQPYPGQPVFVYNNTMAGNDAGIVIAGVPIPSGSRFDNNLIAFNQLGLISFSATPPPFSDNIVYGNATDYADGTPNLTGTDGNISADPKLKDWTNGDVHLLYGSPAIDAGDSTVTQLSSTDFYGDARIVTGKPGDSARVDIGAVEYQPPVVAAVDGSLGALPDVATTGTLACSGADPTEPLTFTLVTAAAHGAVTLAARTGKFIYTPATGYVGGDSFTFQVKDAFGTLSNVATESVTVNDIAPTAQAGSGFSMGGRAVRGQARADITYRGQVLHYSVLQLPTHGSVKLTAAGAYVYTPARGYKGRDSFTYQAIDQWGTASNAAVVKITVR